MANLQRGEAEIRIGGQSRVFRWRTAEMMMLQKRLECDVLHFVARGGGTENFLVESMFCGLARKEKKISPIKIATWLDNDDEVLQFNGAEVTRDELQKEILYTMARGKTAEDAKEMLRVLDEVFSSEDEIDENGVGPLGAGSYESRPQGGTTSFGSEPQSA